MMGVFLASWAVWPFWVLLLLVGGLIAGFFVLLFTVALVEKLPVNPFGPTPLDAFPGDLPPYIGAMNTAAARLGFTYGGTYPHSKGGTYRSYASFWLSPDRRTVVQVAGGTVARLPGKATTLTSRTADGRHLVTKDEVDMGDASGIVDAHLVMHATFDELWDAHQQRLAVSDGRRAACVFEEPSPYEARQAVNRARVARVVERGYGRWTDAGRSAWRHSLRGALRACSVQFFGELRNARRDPERHSKPRPGDVPQGFTVLSPPTLPPGAPTPPTPQTHLFRHDRDFLP